MKTFIDYVMIFCVGFLGGMIAKECVPKIGAAEKPRPDPCEQLMNQCVHGVK